ncbi:hypothetical protein K438DRAFT_1756307 [Mycena galopus ATCC 62051]|nr:hypothetical protein K438DRAFT_1756307 [Mycena galopus ATCC 62051]
MARAKSKTRQTQLACEEKDTLMVRAVTLYLHEHDKVVQNGEKDESASREVKTVIAYACEVSDHGFPLSHRRLKEIVDEICHARLGDKFPAMGIGKKWTGHFVKKHHNCL